MIAPIGLYYPYTHFRDRGWLKVAALYWPAMARIAPLGYADVDNADARVLKGELDFILDLAPESSVLDQVGTDVMAALSLHSALIRERYRIPVEVVETVGGASDAGAERVRYRFPDLASDARVEEPTLRWPRPVDVPDTPSFRRLIGLHRGKVQEDLRLSLEAHRLAVTDASGEYAAVHPNFAWAYMCMLADRIAEAGRLVPVADDAAAYQACGGWTPERFADLLLSRDAPSEGDPDLRARLAMLALRIAVPTDPESVPVDRIVAVRRRYGAELDAFRELIDATAAALTAELAEIESEAVLEAYMAQTVSRRIERPLQDLRKAMRGLGVDTALGAASVKFELPAAAALTAGWASGQPVVAAAGAAFGVGAWYRSWRTARNDLVGTSPVGYLWSVERQLAKRASLRRMVGR